MTSSELKDFYYKRYVAEDGSGRLDLFDDAAPLQEGGKRRVINENGILFLSYFLMLLNRAKMLEAYDKENFSKLYLALEQQSGLTNRHPGNHITRESHDNLVGACVGGLLTNNTYIPSRIYEYGSKNGFCYNNLEPGIFKIESLMQGSDVAIFAITSGNIPELINFVWLMGAFLVQACKSSSSTDNHASSALLGLLSIEGIDAAFKKWGYFPYYMRVIYGMVRSIFISRLYSKYGSIEGLMSLYFKPDHPCIAFAKVLTI